MSQIQITICLLCFVLIIISGTAVLFLYVGSYVGSSVFNFIKLKKGKDSNE